MANNIILENNVFLTCSNNAILIANNTDNCMFINNSFRIGGGNAGISIGGNHNATSKIVNNTLDGDGVTSVGIQVSGSSSGVVDYNNIFDCAVAEYQGASAGANAKTGDPLFVGALDLTLQPTSPSIDAGAGTGTHAEVPTDDFLGTSRPIDYPGVSNVDDGTDMGAYEMAPTSVEYYVNPTGSSTAPYDTPAKGAADFNTLFGGAAVADSDTVHVVGDNGEIDDSGTSTITLDMDVEIKSWESNTNLPVIKVPNASALFHPTGGVSPKIRDLRMYKAGPDASGNFIDPVNSTTNPEITGCEFWVSDTTNNTAKGVDIADRTFSTNCNLDKNVFHDLDTAIYSEGAPETLVNLLVKNNRFYNCSRGIHCTNAVSDADVVNNSFNNVDKPIHFASNFTNGLIINNAMDGQSGTTGVEVATYVSGTCESNVVHDYTTDILISAGAVSAVNTITGDPLFVSASDLQLQDGSSCLDQGVGNGTNAAVPTVDANGVSRPIDQNATDYDDGTDVGAYEAAYFPKQAYVNPAGSNTSPYDTPEKGIPTISGAITALTWKAGDTIYVDGDNGEIDDSTIKANDVPPGVTIEGSGSERPRIKITNDELFLSADEPGAKVKGIDFYKAGPNAANYFMAIGGDSAGGQEIEDCTFEVEDDTGNAADGIFVGDGVKTGIAKVMKNIFTGMRYAVYSTGAGATVSNVVIDNNRYISCDRGVWIAQPAIDFHVVNNSFYDVDMAIDFDNDLTMSNILNNILDGNGGTTGIKVDNYISGAVDYNCVHDYTTPYDLTGAVSSPGAGSITDDPLFVAADDLRLQNTSPCLDAGIRTGYTAIVPTVDCVGRARPVDQTGIVNVDDGTDMGAFEMPTIDIDTIVSTLSNPVEVITQLNKLHRVSRSIADLDNFQATPGKWANLDSNGKLIDVEDYSSPLCKLLLNYVNSSYYETHDTKAARVTTLEDFGYRIAVANSVYVGEPAVDDLLTVSAQVGSEGQLIKIGSPLLPGDYYAFARVKQAFADKGFIIIETVSPYLVTI